MADQELNVGVKLTVSEVEGIQKLAAKLGQATKEGVEKGSAKAKVGEDRLSDFQRDLVNALGNLDAAGVAKAVGGKAASSALEAAGVSPGIAKDLGGPIAQAVIGAIQSIPSIMAPQMAATQSSAFMEQARLGWQKAIPGLQGMEAKSHSAGALDVMAAQVYQLKMMGIEPGAMETERALYKLSSKMEAANKASDQFKTFAIERGFFDDKTMLDKLMHMVGF